MKAVPAVFTWEDSSWNNQSQSRLLVIATQSLGNLSTRRFLGDDGNGKSNLLPFHVSHRHGQQLRLCANFVYFDVACKTWVSPLWFSYFYMILLLKFCSYWCLSCYFTVEELAWTVVMYLFSLFEHFRLCREDGYQQTTCNGMNRWAWHSFFAWNDC